MPSDVTSEIIEKKVARMFDVIFACTKFAKQRLDQHRQQHAEHEEGEHSDDSFDHRKNNNEQHDQIVDHREHFRELPAFFHDVRQFGGGSTDQRFDGENQADLTRRIAEPRKILLVRKTRR